MGKQIVAKINNLTRGRGKLELGMLWLLRTPWWLDKLGPVPASSQGLRLLVRKVRPALRAYGAEVGRRLGWHKWPCFWQWLQVGGVSIAFISESISL